MIPRAYYLCTNLFTYLFGFINWFFHSVIHEWIFIDWLIHSFLQTDLHKVVLPSCQLLYLYDHSDDPSQWLCHKGYYYIPEKSPYTLPLELSCNKSLSLNDDLSFSALWPQRSASANSNGACLLCLHNSTVCFGCVTKVPGRCYMPRRHKEEKHCGQYRVKMVFSCQKYDLISLNMCLKWSSRYIIMKFVRDVHLFVHTQIVEIVR